MRSDQVTCRAFTISSYVHPVGVKGLASWRWTVVQSARKPLLSLTMETSLKGDYCKETERERKRLATTVIGGWFALPLTLFIVQAQWPSVHRHCRLWFRPSLRDIETTIPPDKLIVESWSICRIDARRICMQSPMIVIYVGALVSWRLWLHSTMLSVASWTMYIRVNELPCIERG